MDQESLRLFLSYFNIKAFVYANPPLYLAAILAGMVLLFAAVHFLSPLVKKRLEHVATKKYRKATHREEDGQAEGDGMPTPLIDAMDFAMFERVTRNLERLLYYSILYWGFHMLHLAAIYRRIGSVILGIICTLAAIELLSSCVPFFFDLYMRRHGTTFKNSHSRAMMPILKGLVWALGLTFMLDNLGFQVSTIIAGLGIMGVAVGLAGQAILSDFFSYLVILLDHPFRIGDYVELGDGRAGGVEYMGPKTTHLRSLTDDVIVCANSEMTRGTLTNLGNVYERQVIVPISVEYGTPPDKLNAIPDLLRDVINNFPHCFFDRACMLAFGDSGLKFELLYFVRGMENDIRGFMNTRSAVNMAILERFGREGISMPYNTTHVILTEDHTPAQPPVPERPLAAHAAARGSHGDAANQGMPQQAPPA